MKIQVATPMYGGQNFGVYHNSVLSLISEASMRGHQLEFSHTYNESLIQRARNTIASMFLANSKADILLFIDGDIRFDAKALVDMIEEGKDVIGAITPTKAINFQGVFLGAEKDKSLENISKYMGFFNFNKSAFSEEDKQLIYDNKSFEVDRIGTGVMAITRNVFEKLANEVKTYKDDNPLFQNKDRWDFFPVTIEYDADWKANRMMSEDYNLCNLWRKTGGKVFAKGGVVQGHSGYHEYTGDVKSFVELQEYIKEKQNDK